MQAHTSRTPYHLFFQLLKEGCNKGQVQLHINDGHIQPSPKNQPIDINSS